MLKENQPLSVKAIGGLALKPVAIPCISSSDHVANGGQYYPHRFLNLEPIPGTQKAVEAKTEKVLSSCDPDTVSSFLERKGICNRDLIGVTPLTTFGSFLVGTVECFEDDRPTRYLTILGEVQNQAANRLCPELRKRLKRTSLEGLMRSKNPKGEASERITQASREFFDQHPLYLIARKLRDTFAWAPPSFMASKEQRQQIEQTIASLLIPSRGPYSPITVRTREIQRLDSDLIVAGYDLVITRPDFPTPESTFPGYSPQDKARRMTELRPYGDRFDMKTAILDPKIVLADNPENAIGPGWQEYYLILKKLVEFQERGTFSNVSNVLKCLEGKRLKRLFQGGINGPAAAAVLNSLVASAYHAIQDAGLRTAALKYDQEFKAAFAGYNG